MRNHLLLLVLIVCAGCSTEDKLNIDHLRIIAHRGISWGMPENSLRAIDKAREVGVSAVEFDVQLSKDNELMVFHDEYLFRMTGLHGSISNYTKEELQTFCLKDNQENLTEETVPGLDAVFETLGDQIEYYIELKTHSAVAEMKLVEMIEWYGLESKVSILSFDNNCLKRISELNANIALRLLVYDWTQLPESYFDAKEYAHLRSIIFDCNSVNWNLLKKFNRWVDELEVYAIETVEELDAKCYRYLKGVITSFP
jgi:glycerophosphoryl diester phosphodiesterase